MLQTQDGRVFFTEKKNLLCLIDFAKSHKIRIAIVKTDKSNILDLKNLVSAICNSENFVVPKYQMIKEIYPKLDHSRDDLLKNAGKIRKHIKNLMLTGNTVSLEVLHSKFEDLNLTKACLCNHLSFVRKELAKEGYNVTKIGKKYKIV